MMFKKLLIITVFILLLFSCKIISVKDKDITGKVLFKGLQRKSKKIDYAYISGFFKITGVDEVPPVLLKYETFCKFKEKKALLKISSLKTEIFDILLSEENIILVNHTNKEYIKLNIEQIDFSKIIGVNFNPLDIGYFLLGNIPYSESMELIDFKWSKKEYILDISDNISKYTIYMNADEELQYVNIYNQYFDYLILKSIKYKKNSNGLNMPNMLVFTTEENDIQMTFIIKKILLKGKIKKDLFNPEYIKEYSELNTIDEINVKIKNKE